jgi:hypothetical protein
LVTRARACLDGLARGAFLGGSLLSSGAELLVPGTRLEDALLAAGGDLPELTRGREQSRPRGVTAIP